jgi:uncharacterized protein (TIGR00159 family)
MLNTIFTLQSAADILIVALGIYLLLIFIKQTRSYFIVYGLLGLGALSIISDRFDLGLTRKMLGPFLTFFLIIFFIVFQSEIRRFFRWLALSRGRLEKRVAYLDEAVVTYLTDAIMEMAKRRLGAIIVLSGEYPLDDTIRGGFTLDGKITAALILSIFDDSTPGHDGAILIENRRISKFGVHLPLAEEFKGFATMGTRHRAASGITERTDAMAIVVSEERGTISVAQEGTLKSLPDRKSVEDTLHTFFKEEHAPTSLWEIFISSNLLLKAVSLVVAAALWFFFIFQANVVTKDIIVPVQLQGVAEGLQVTSVLPSQITLTVSGKDQDINALQPSDFNVVAGLKDKGEGAYTIMLSEEDITKPSFVTITKFTPKKMTVTLDQPEPVQP